MDCINQSNWWLVLNGSAASNPAGLSRLGATRLYLTLANRAPKNCLEAGLSKGRFRHPRLLDLEEWGGFPGLVLPALGPAL